MASAMLTISATAINVGFAEISKAFLYVYIWVCRRTANFSIVALLFMGLTLTEPLLSNFVS